MKKYKCISLLFVYAVQMLLYACSSSDECSNKSLLSPEDVFLYTDSIYLFDTLVFKDSVYLKDTIVFKDSILFKDTIYSKDTIVIKDTLYHKDTLLTKDTIVIKDTLYHKDTLLTKDTIVIKDTLYHKDTVVFLYQPDSIVVEQRHFKHIAKDVFPEEIKSFHDANISKNVLLAFSISGKIENVSCGISYQENYGKWVEVTPDSVFVKKGKNGEIEKSLFHGLSFEKNMSIVIHKDGTDENAVASLSDGNGNSYSFEIDWRNIWGHSFILNENSSGSISANIVFVPKDIEKKIWIFGDSYLGLYNYQRWMYYIVNAYGFTNFLLDALPGAGSALLSDLKNLLSVSNPPSYIVWCIGMNDGGDDNSVNVNWKRAIDDIITICRQNNIIPVFATIPSIPTRDHSKKNAYLKSLNVRIIDIAAAVEEEGTNTWKKYGAENAFLSKDGVHPSEFGAKAMANRFILDFPEISIDR